MTFLLSTLALVSAPLLYGLLERYRGSRDALEGFVLVTIAGIVGLHIVPEAWRLAGWASGVCLLAGVLFPLILERVYRRVLERAHLFVLLLAAAGIVVHAVLDGIALLPTLGRTGLLENELALGVILHRLPVGVAVWWVLRPQFGVRAAVGVLALIVIVTGLGYRFGSDLVDADLTSLALFQSFIAGSLLHVALVGTAHGHAQHHTHHDGSAGGHGASVLRAFRGRPAPFWAGVAAGLLVVLLLPHITLGS